MRKYYFVEFLACLFVAGAIAALAELSNGTDSVYGALGLSESVKSKLLLFGLSVSLVLVLFSRLVMDVATGKGIWPLEGEDRVRSSIIIAVSIVAASLILGLMIGGAY